jgi:putative two-component system response regulator
MYESNHIASPSATSPTYHTQPLVRPDRATGPLPDPRTLIGRDQRQSRVLIVDDEASLRKLVVAQLSDDHHCDSASSGPEAVKMLEEASYDIVMTDINMPKMSGLDLLGWLRIHAPSTVVIMITGIQDTRLAIESVRMGAFDYILKPFDIDEIGLSVRRAIRFRETQQQLSAYRSRLEALVVERTASLQREKEQIETTLLETTLAFRATLNELTSAIETRDLEAHGNTARVVAYATRLGVQLGLSQDELVALEHGALLHDIGTIYIPEEILRKPSALTPDERAIMQKHTEYGARLVGRIGMLAEAAAIVEQHHERWDGSGYPRGLAGEEIDLRARIFAVADCVDAMLNERPYSAAKTLEEISDELRRCRGIQFDPAVVDAFFEVAPAEWRRIDSSPFTQSISVTGPLDARLIGA